MAKLKWDKQFETGVQIVDDQHRVLIDIINELVANMTQLRRFFKGRKGILEIIVRLNDYVSTHFRTEEELMEKAAFSGLKAHREEHLSFEKLIRDFEAEYKEGKVNISIELLEFLTNWVVNHILQTDKQYVQAVKEKGVG